MTKEERRRKRERILRVVHGLLLAHDYAGIERIWSRLSWQSFDSWLECAIEVQTDSVTDTGIYHADLVAAHIDAMSDAGFDWRGRKNKGRK